jgi:hypothetical protein
VYIAGHDYNGTASEPCYSKNGTRYDLNGDFAGSIAVSGSDVYILGAYQNGNRYQPCYWKNGTRYGLSIPAIANGHASAIAFDGGDVHILGDYDEDGSMHYKAAYWKNGVMTGLPADLIMAEAIVIK